MESLPVLIGVAILFAILIKVARWSSVPADVARPGRPRTDLSVQKLTDVLQRGELPAPVSASFGMRPGEVCVGVVEADVEQWLEGDGIYLKKHVSYGGLAGFAVGSAVSAVGNSRRRAAAEREAAERWRMVGTYQIYVTTERIALEGGRGREWAEVWLSDVRRIEAIDSAVELHIVGTAATRIYAAPDDYWCLLLRRLAFGEVPGRDAAG